jgi:cytochrome c oxidase cbb3-type subunit 3
MIFGAILAALVLGGGLFLSLRTANLYSRLLRGDPDAIAEKPELARFAASVAKPVYDRRCASCHGADMKGDRSRGVPNLIDQDWLYGSGRPVEVERTILYGIRASLPRTWNLADMPAFGQANPYRRYKVAPLSPGQIKDVVEFVRVLERKPADPLMASRGGKIFADTGQCFDCHSTDGAGDSAIGAPNLVDDIWLYGDGSRQSVFNSIAHGHAGVCPAWSTVLKPGQVRALAIYISNLAKPGRSGTARATAASQQQGRPS